METDIAVVTVGCGTDRFNGEIFRDCHGAIEVNESVVGVDQGHAERDGIRVDVDTFCRSGCDVSRECRRGRSGELVEADGFDRRTGGNIIGAGDRNGTELLIRAAADRSGQCDVACTGREAKCVAFVSSTVERVREHDIARRHSGGDIDTCLEHGCVRDRDVAAGSSTRTRATDGCHIAIQRDRAAAAIERNVAGVAARRCAATRRITARRRDVEDGNGAGRCRSVNVDLTAIVSSPVCCRVGSTCRDDITGQIYVPSCVDVDRSGVSPGSSGRRDVVARCADYVLTDIDVDQATHRGNRFVDDNIAGVRCVKRHSAGRGHDSGLAIDDCDRAGRIECDNTVAVLIEPDDADRIGFVKHDAARCHIEDIDAVDFSVDVAG